ncbi:hypothetical protein P7K49_024459 [Saguinus oedipus]|uniref:Uncharacterized protein n=1 Tax=Saguinus oedipus TaxID=9490 RepID=A0ABQ9UR77_SAGOE|nr:hypothetical protein P7K49_024459 [Saguinus oedipus]
MVEGTKQEHAELVIAILENLKHQMLLEEGTLGFWEVETQTHKHEDTLSLQGKALGEPSEPLVPIYSLHGPLPPLPFLSHHSGVLLSYTTGMCGKTLLAVLIFRGVEVFFYDSSREKAALRLSLLVGVGQECACSAFVQERLDSTDSGEDSGDQESQQHMLELGSAPRPCRPLSPPASRVKVATLDFTNVPRREKSDTAVFTQKALETPLRSYLLLKEKEHTFPCRERSQRALTQGLD